MRLIASMLGCSFILSAYLRLRLLISSLTYGTLRSWCRASLVTYQYALTMIQRYLFWNLWSTFIFDLEAVPQNWTLYIHISLRIALYNSTLFSIDNCDLLLSSQYILLSSIPSCFLLVVICFLQFSPQSKRNPKYIVSSSWRFSGRLRLLMDTSLCRWWMSPVQILPHWFWFSNSLAISECRKGFRYKGEDASTWFLWIARIAVSTAVAVVVPKANGRSAVYSRQSIGSSTLPCGGTLELIPFNCVTASPYLTPKILCRRYDFMIAYISHRKQLLIL